MDSKVIEIRFSDLLAMLLKAGKLILCLTLVLGLLGAAYGICLVIKSQPQATQESIDDAKQRVAIAEQDLARAQSVLAIRNEVTLQSAWEKLERSKRLILQMQAYMKNSVYYGMDPFNRGAAHMRFAVETGDITGVNSIDTSSDRRIGIVVAYTQMFPFDSKTIENVRDIMGIDSQAQYIEELISITCDEDYRVVEICVRFDDLSVAEQVVIYLYETMTAWAEDNLPEHRTKVLTIYSGFEVDWDMSNSHVEHEESLKATEETLLDANEMIVDLNSNLNKEQQAVDSAMGALKLAQEALNDIQVLQRPSIRSMAKQASKYGFLGGVVGIILGCGYSLIKGVFGGIVQNQNEIMSRYSFPMIGVLPRAKKVWFDNIICKLEGEPIGDRELITQSIVQSLLSRIGDYTVCLVSTGGHAVTDKLAMHIGNRAISCGNIIDTPEAVKELASCNGVVFVEQRGKSRIDLIDAEVLRTKTLQKDIIGMVLI